MKHTTIRGLVRTSEDATAGSGRNTGSGRRAWYAYTEEGVRVPPTDEYVNVRVVYHYSTVMLEYVTEDDGYTWDGDIDTVIFSTGHGSVSDQNGMNKLFRETGIPAYFERAGGAGYVWLPRERYYA